MDVNNFRLMVDKLDFGDRHSNWLEKAREAQLELKANHSSLNIIIDSGRCLGKLR